MKTEEEIRKRIRRQKEQRWRYPERYGSDWDNLKRSQIQALEWVLRNTKSEGGKS